MDYTQAQNILIKTETMAEFTEERTEFTNAEILQFIEAAKIIERERCNKILQEEIRLDMPFFVTEKNQSFDKSAVEKILRGCIRYWKYLKKVAGKKILMSNPKLDVAPAQTDISSL